MLVVDGTQSVGALAMKADGCNIDALCVSAHKWLLGPLGIGFAHSSDRHQPAPPLGHRLAQRQEPFRFTPEPGLADDGRRFESGTENAAGIAGLAATTSLALGIGTDTIEKIVLERADHLEQNCKRHGLSSPRDQQQSRHSGILIISSGRVETALHSRLIEATIRCSLRATGVRFSSHYFITPKDLEAFDNALRDADAANK